MKSFLLIVVVAVQVMPGAAGAQNAGALANDTKSPSAAHGAEMTPELKKDMADMYQKMADCLRTDKSLDQCSQDAMKDCPVLQKTGHCPINEGMGPMKGKRTKHPKGSKGGMEMGK